MKAGTATNRGRGARVAVRPPDSAANQVSSRSHAVLQITIEQSERTAHVTGNVRIGKLSMVDLAGSERQSKTQASGDRLKEATKINLSLSALVWDPVGPIASLK